MSEPRSDILYILCQETPDGSYTMWSHDLGKVREEAQQHWDEGELTQVLKVYVEFFSGMITNHGPFGAEIFCEEVDVEELMGPRHESYEVIEEE